MLKRRINIRLITLLVCSLAIIVKSCTKKPSPIFSYQIENPSEIDFQDQLLFLNSPDLLKVLNSNPHESIIIKSDDNTLPFQLETIPESKEIYSISVLVDIMKKTSKQIDIFSAKATKNAFTKRTQAEISVKEGGNWKQVKKKNGTIQFEYEGGEFQNISYLRVPDEHTDHSFFIRYEGPGWESDKVGYRFYLDWRNAVDIFGKKTPEMVLQNVGQDGFESYHELSDWGMDVLKVGSSLGIGSIAYYTKNKALRIEKTDSTTCSIPQNGSILSSIKTVYHGWQVPDNTVDLISNISIGAGSRLTHQQITLSESIENICTGIVKHELAELLVSNNSADQWGYIATFGKQSLNNDHLGMLILYRHKDLIEITEDEHSHIIILKPESNTVDYHFGATWELDADNINTLEKFRNYADKILFQFNNPLSIKAIN